MQYYLMDEVFGQDSSVDFTSHSEDCSRDEEENENHRAMRGHGSKKLKCKIVKNAVRNGKKRKE